MSKWIAHTDGKDVWAIASDGSRKRCVQTTSSKVQSAVSNGDEINIITEDGRVRTWNPKTDSLRMVR
jgi:hypothetical protein